MRVFQAISRDRAGRICQSVKWNAEVKNHSGIVRRIPAFPDRRGSEVCSHNVAALSAAGMHPKKVQTLARHTTITLTLDRYSHITLESQIDTVSALPDLSADTETAMVRMGTNGQNLLGVLLGRNPAKTCEGERQRDRRGRGAKNAKNQPPGAT